LQAFFIQILSKAIQIVGLWTSTFQNEALCDQAQVGIVTVDSGVLFCIAM